MLTQTIAEIVKYIPTIEKHNFEEAATKQYIVLPILRALDWQDANFHTLEVYPERRIGKTNTKVDYALQHQRTALAQRDALVFVECKRWGDNIERHQEQICQYAFQEGVEIAVITNGKLWDFYLPDRTSTPEKRVVPWEERIFCSIDIEMQQEQAVSEFQKYLLKANVQQGDAKANAREAFQPQKPETPSPRRNYARPILRALVELGGSAKTNKVLNAVYRSMDDANELRQVDKSRRSDGQFYWKNRSQDMRRELIHRGFMLSDSELGLWEIADVGREFLNT